MLVKDVISFLENKQKIWAFCLIRKNSKIKEIHYWFSKNKDLKIYDMASVFGHELAHATGIKSEHTAGKYAAVSSFVLMLLMPEIKRKLKRK